MPLGLRIGAPVVVLVVLLAAWQFVASPGAVPTALLPGPGRVLARLVAEEAAEEVVERGAIGLVTHDASLVAQYGGALEAHWVCAESIKGTGAAGAEQVRPGQRCATMSGWTRTTTPHPPPRTPIPPPPSAALLTVAPDRAPTRSTLAPTGPGWQAAAGRSPCGRGSPPLGRPSPSWS